METQIFTETLVIMHCGKCGIAFGMTESKYTRCKEKGEDWYCPNGHCRIFTTSALDEKDAEIKRLKENNAWLDRRLTSERETREVTERRLRAQKGVTTRLKKRAANGVCPCCNRYFENLHRHMTSQHPDFSAPEHEENTPQT